ncbi:MAG: hypothetical protein N4J56_004080 [Chroococcidiopsis sp. SAG 2025]|uniref:hypothetical protein n=1 Tax=Chroococcidiopsis sp. SAG 2025 TaxID=171389 RepID=UPI002937380B|nr:hypothetical protein [Chroococcidiopsis sp. SAG 2025]MDV2994426.1 hypothetical protein [Chroococcidiopsis sp. SAG 2025]
MMDNPQSATNDLNENIDWLRSEVQNRIQKVQQALQQEFHNLYRDTISHRQQEIDAIKSGIEEELDTFKKEVATLQVEVMQSKKPKKWYGEASTIIAVLAIVFSFGTAMASYLQVDSQNRRAARSELRGIIQRLVALPKESAETLNTYKNNAVILNGLLSSINQEYVLLSGQAVELVNRIPNDISAPEYVSIAQALINQGITTQVPIFLDTGLKVSKDINSELALLRNYGNYLFMTGNINSGRKKYQEAMSIFGKYSVSNQYFIESANAYTEIV